MLHGHFKNKLICHFLAHEAPRLPTEKPALTHLGAIVFKMFPLNNSGHLTYVRLECDGHTQQATLFDPVSLTVESRFCYIHIKIKPYVIKVLHFLIYL